MKLAIYLAGNIQKGHEHESCIFWTEVERNCLVKELKPIQLTFLNPAHRNDDLSDQKSVFGRDMTQVTCSDLLLVDARERRGLGVGAEMMWAKINKIPIVTLASPESHYRKSCVKLLGVEVKNWIHPFVESLSDVIISNFQEAANWIKSYVHGGIEEIKGSEFIYEAIQHYKESQFLKDQPMIDIVDKCNVLKQRFSSVGNPTAQ